MDKLSASGSEEDEDEKFLNDDTFLKEQQTERFDKVEAFRHVSCLMELNIYDIWVSRSNWQTLQSDKEHNKMIHSYVKDTKNRNIITMT